ncbi:MAG TPA: spore coat U domain-containing protein [Casimicrobiaceae bacterium]|nr:spore coat U domain-containing protein [Casimicrobiaceae bacterium]
MRTMLAALLALLVGEAYAASCSVSTPGVAFGTYDVFAASPTSSTGSIKVTCTLGAELFVRVNYTVSLATGSSNTFVQRTMKSGANALGYNLYTSNAYSTVWGDGTGSTNTLGGSMTLSIFNTSDSVTMTVYGRVPALQDVAVANNYQDNVTVTVTY